MRAPPLPASAFSCTGAIPWASYLRFRLPEWLALSPALSLPIRLPSCIVPVCAATPTRSPRPQLHTSTACNPTLQPASRPHPQLVVWVMVLVLLACWWWCC